MCGLKLVILSESQNTSLLLTFTRQYTPQVNIMPPERKACVEIEFERHLFQWAKEIHYYETAVTAETDDDSPQEGQQLFLRRMRKIMRGKGYDLAEHESDLWDAWRNISDEGRELWALEEARDMNVEEPFLEMLKRLPEEWMTAPGIYILTFREICPTVTEDDCEDYWVMHYFQQLTLELIVDALNSVSVRE